MSLAEGVRYFVEDKRLLSCLSVTCGDRRSTLQAAGGVMDLAGRPLAEDALFDLASLTKLFTALTVLRLREEGVLTLSRPVTDYAPCFPNLREVTVEDVLTFACGLVTPQRVDAQKTRGAGLAQLMAIAPAPQPNRAYSDMHSMVLRYVAEGAAGVPLMSSIRRVILDPLSMRETFACVPDALRSRCVSCDREHRIEGDRYVLRAGVAPGTPHDPKAALLQAGDDVCGHAGLFSTRSDMVRLCQGVLEERIVSRESLRFMAVNRTGRPLPGGGHTQYLGCQCFVKHPEQYFSEIPVYMGREAIGLSGFTGHHVSIDPERGIFALFLGNRVLDRLTVLLPAPGRSRSDYGLAEDGSGWVRWTDGSRVTSSVDYVHHKDAQLHARIARAMDL